MRYFPRDPAHGLQLLDAGVDLVLCPQWLFLPDHWRRGGIRLVWGEQRRSHAEAPTGPDYPAGRTAGAAL